MKDLINNNKLISWVEENFTHKPTFTPDRLNDKALKLEKCLNKSKQLIKDNEEMIKELEEEYKSYAATTTIKNEKGEDVKIPTLLYQKSGMGL